MTQLRGQIKPGGSDMLWLVQDFETAIRSELDCEHEARNCEIAARYSVYLLYWCFTGAKGQLLTGRKALVAVAKMRCCARRAVVYSYTHSE